MKCSVCEHQIDLAMKAAISRNFCPFCGQNLFDEKQEGLKQSIESSLSSLSLSESLTDPDSVARIAAVIVASFSSEIPVQPKAKDSPQSEGPPSRPVSQEKRKPKPISRDGVALSSSPSEQGDFFAGMSKEELLGLNWEPVREDNSPDSDDEDYSEFFPESSEDPDMKARAERLMEKASRRK